MFPEISIVKVKDTYIYIKNILNWARDNPGLKEMLEVPFDDLINSIDQVVDKFKPILEKNKTHILKRIPEISGFPWSDDNHCIHVYPTPFFNSFSHPLFLKVCRLKAGKIVGRKNGHILGTLIHELCHNNFKNLPVERGMNESLINYIVLTILDEVDSIYTKEYLDFHEKIGSKIDLSRIPESIKSGRQSIVTLFLKQQKKSS